MKNKKYQEFSVGRAGSGRIDLATGELEFVHEDTSSDSSILPINISHVYSRQNISTTYGKGFKLNLNQTLTYEGDDTKWKYADGNGVEHKFEEYYYYKVEEIGENGQPRTRKSFDTVAKKSDQIKIDKYGRLFEIATGKEIFAEIKTKSGLQLHTQLKNFNDSDKIETRHEELIQVENDIESLNKNIKDLEFFIADNEVMESASYNNLVSKQKEIEKYALEFERRSFNLQASIDQKKEDLLTKSNSLNAAYQSTSNEQDYYSPGLQTAVSKAAYDFDNESWQVQKKLTSIANSSGGKNQEELLNKRESFQGLKDTFDSVEEARLKTQRQQQKEMAENLKTKYEILLSQREYDCKKLKEQLPVNFVIDEGVILGFNSLSRGGRLVSIFDSYDNQTVIVYDDKNRIEKVINSDETEIVFEYICDKLVSITDNQERKTKFEYDNDFLVKVIYPNNEESIFSYPGNKLTEIINSSKMGVRLKYDGERVNRIINFSNLKSINENGKNELTISGTEKIDTEIQIVCDSNCNCSANISTLTRTCVINQKEGIHEVNLFDATGEFVTEYLKVDDELKSLVIYDVSKDTYNFVYSQTRFSNGFDVISTIESILFNGERNFESIENMSGEDITYCEFNDDRNIVLEYTKSKRLSGKIDSVKKEFIYDDKGNLTTEFVLIQEADKPARNLKTTFDYDKFGKPIRVTDTASGIVEETIYDQNGNVTKTQAYHVSNPSAKFISEQEVAENGKVISEIDELGNKTAIKYKDRTNIICGYTNPKGGKLSCDFDPYTNEVLSITSDTNGESNETTYKYKAGFLTEVVSNNVKFGYSYDHFGRNNAITKNINNYVNYEFEERDGFELVRTLYANNEGYETWTNKKGLTQFVYYIKNGAKSLFIENIFGDTGVKKDMLVRTENKKTGEVTEFDYDNDGNLISELGKVSINTEFKPDGSKVTQTIIVDGKPTTYNYQFDEDDELTELIQENLGTEKIFSDNLDRVTKYQTAIGTKEIDYFQADDRATNLPVSVTQKLNDGTFSKQRYTYDANGNITKIYEAGQMILRYEYDALDRITREDNRQLGRTYTYEYDKNGNILYKRKFDFTLDDDLYGEEFELYQYDGDQLIKKNEIGNYDVIGNPKLYRGKELKWSHVRNLERFGSTKFEHNASNLRTRKIHGENNTEYFWSDDQLVAEKRTREWSDLVVGEPFQGGYCYSADDCFITYLYGVDGVSGFTVEKDGHVDTYHYRKNLFGDVTHIYDVEQNCVAEYVYDAWGNHLIVKDFDGIGTLNPIRYRSYYWDNDLQMYYLKSRWYDSTTGRFINMDAIEQIEPDTINGLNLFVYCGNNPVMNIDPTGFGWNSFWNKVGKGVSKFLRGVESGITNFINGITDAVTHPVKTTKNTYQAFRNDFWGTLYHMVDFVNPYEYYKSYKTGGINGLGEHFGNSLGEIGLIFLTAGVGKAASVAVRSGVNVTARAPKIVIRTVRRSELTKSARMVRAGLSKTANGYTISNRMAGQLIHKGFMKEIPIRGVGRLDGLKRKTIFELKPNNPRAIKAGIKQLKRYKKALGGRFKLVLVVY